LLDITTRKEYPATPQYFTRTALPIKYNPKAKCPLFRKFLADVLNDDGLFALMQQWFGHLITTDVSEVNAGNRQILEDAISVINGITGEDRQHIQRKYKGALDLAFKLHVVLMGNGYPDFGEHAAAFGARVDVIPFRISYAGREDTTLTARLLDELPGILNFALDGLKDLREGATPRKFKIVAASEEAKREMLNSGNTVRAFVADLCELGAWEVDKDEFYADYFRYTVTIKAYAFPKPVFFKKLKEAFPGLGATRPTIDGTRDNFIAGIRLREMGPPTTITKTFMLDLDAMAINAMADDNGEPLILIDPITEDYVEAVENEFPGWSE
jgi:phage/plasmid-associated DNA primase